MSLNRFLSLLLCLAATVGLLVVPAIAAAAGDLTPTPTHLEFGTQDIHAGQTNFQEVKLSNSTGEELTVSSTVITGPDAPHFSHNDNCGFLADGDSCTVNLAFDPIDPGPKEAQLEILDDKGTVTVPLSGVGATGTLTGFSPSFDPQPFFFGGQQRSANISNLSAYSVSGTNATISGPDAAYFSIGFSGCQFVLNPGNNCSIGVNFNPSGPGTKVAQLELSNDGTVDPLVIPLTATALAGPDAVLSPAQANFGDVAIGSSSISQTFEIENAGDYPLQVQQIFVLSGTPQLFPISSDTCSSQQILPAASCQLSLRFQPTGAGERQGTVFAITNENGPVTTASFVGYGMPSPQGSASVVGAATAGSPLTCTPAGFPDGTTIAYQWLRNGSPLNGSDSMITPTDVDVGARFSCRVLATNPVGSQTVASPDSAPIAARNLSGLNGSLVNESVCRAAQAPARLKVGSRTVAVSYGKPITPSSSLALDAPHLKMAAMVDGQTLTQGTGHLALTPRSLQGLADGTHTLQVSSGARVGSLQLGLAPCRLAVSLAGGPSRATNLVVSSAAGMASPSVRLSGKLSLHLTPGRLGRMSIEVAGHPVQTFGLGGARTSSNGITVSLKAHSVQIKNLPPETGVVRIKLDAGVVTGKGGTVRAQATLRGESNAASASADADWHR